MARKLKVALCCLRIATVMLSARPAGAQDRWAAGVDLSIARHALQGMVVDGRTGALIDLLVVAPVRASTNWSPIVAGGGGLVLGPIGESCVLAPDGGCAPKGHFRVVNALIGVALPVGPTLARVFTGPVLYDGAGHRSVGLQTRLDLSVPILARFGLGAMLEAGVLPSHGGDRVTTLVAGGSLALRKKR